MNPTQGKTLCEIFMEERGHILHGDQSEQAVEGKTGKGVDGLVSGKPLRGTPTSRNPSKVPLNRILDKSELTTTSPLYLTRLVRALNAEAMTGNGFYASIATHYALCNMARIRRGVLECRSAACDPMWFTPSRNSFMDVYSRKITASRHS